jgi:hypothetical protein
MSSRPWAGAGLDAGGRHRRGARDAGPERLPARARAPPGQDRRRVLSGSRAARGFSSRAGGVSRAGSRSPGPGAPARVPRIEPGGLDEGHYQCSPFAGGAARAQLRHSRTGRTTASADTTTREPRAAELRGGGWLRSTVEFRGQARSPSAPVRR